LALLKKDTRIFEGILGEILKQSFPGRFALPEAAEGAYLPGYGVVVSFHLNINRADIRTPFGVIQAGNKEKRTTEEQVQILKESRMRGLRDYGTTFDQLPGGESISISAHVEDRSELDTSENTAIIVMTAFKDDLDLVAAGKISKEEFEKKVRVLQY
jgi:hypothetical protein